MKSIDSISDYLASSSTGNFFLLAGPCVIEGEQMALDIAEMYRKYAKGLISRMYSKVVTVRPIVRVSIPLLESEIWKLLRYLKK